jgi:hypothetical protein
LQCLIFPYLPHILNAFPATIEGHSQGLYVMHSLKTSSRKGLGHISLSQPLYAHGLEKLRKQRKPASGGDLLLRPLKLERKHGLLYYINGPSWIFGFHQIGEYYTFYKSLIQEGFFVFEELNIYFTEGYLWKSGTPKKGLRNSFSFSLIRM